MPISKLDEFLQMMGSDTYMPKEYYRDIFHYTSPVGCTSILTEDSSALTLWASRYDCLNDISEGELVQDRYRQVCEELLENGQISNYLYELFSEIQPARTILIPINGNHTIRVKRVEYDYYVCSFSKNSDSLAMWNYYSKSSKYEGYNIGFYAMIKENIESFFESKEAVADIYPVIYENTAQKELIRALLLKMKELYSQEQGTSIRYVISNKLTEWRLVFKSDYFKHEEEVRIVVKVSKKGSGIPLKFRNNAGYLIPYIELKLDKSMVSYVNVGPLNCPEEQKSQQVKVIEEFLKVHGYSAIVDYSKIPVRY